MIYRRYGTSFQSVDVDFDANAFNDIGFRRNRQHAIPIADLEGAYTRLGTVELRAEAEGLVQTETKQDLLDLLREKLEALLPELPEGGLLVVENESGHDFPKTRQDTKNVIEKGENALHFTYSVEPSLRVARYAPTP